MTALLSRYNCVCKVIRYVDWTMHKTSTGFVFKRAKIFSTFFIDSRTKTPLDEEKVSCYAIWERSTSNLVVSLNSFLT